MPARRFRVVGRVQGVGFRRFAARAAAELGVVGTVRNLPDGTVEVVARAAGQATLDELRRRLLDGPRLAKVTNVESWEILDEAVSETDFNITL